MFPRQMFPRQRFPRLGFPRQTFPRQRFPRQMFPRQMFPRQMFPRQRFPRQRFPRQMFPWQMFPRQRFPRQMFPRQMFPRQGFPRQMFPRQRFPRQMFPRQMFPRQRFPRQGFPRQMFPRQRFPRQMFPRQRFPRQGFPRQMLPRQRFPRQVFPRQPDCHPNIGNHRINPPTDTLTARQRDRGPGQTGTKGSRSRSTNEAGGPRQTRRVDGVHGELEVGQRSWRGIRGWAQRRYPECTWVWLRRSNTDGYPGDLLSWAASIWNTASWVLTRGTVTYPERTWMLRTRRRGYPEWTWVWFLPSGRNGYPGDLFSGTASIRNHRFPGLDAGDRAGSRMNLDTAQPKKTIPRMDLGLVPPVRQERISGRPVLRNSVHTEHRFPGLDAGNRAGSRMNLDTAQLMETEPRMQLGEPLRVNMIRARGGEVEVTYEEPEFGGSRAAPPQGADCGRPSRSANEGSANDGSDESEAEGRPGTRRRRRRLPEVPCSTASSEERHHGTDSGGRSRARATETYRKSTSTQKSSTLVPEARTGISAWRKAHSPTLTNRKTKTKTSTPYSWNSRRVSPRERNNNSRQGSRLYA